MDIQFYRYVLTYTSTDSFTYWNQTVLPFESMDPDKTSLELEFLDLVQRVSGKFVYHGIDLNRSDFVSLYDGKLELPTIYTLDEWFEINKPQVES